MNENNKVNLRFLILKEESEYQFVTEKFNNVNKEQLLLCLYVSLRKRMKVKYSVCENEARSDETHGAVSLHHQVQNV